jgi:hypothetical protein
MSSKTVENTPIIEINGNEALVSEHEMYVIDGFQSI